MAMTSDALKAADVEQNLKHFDSVIVGLGTTGMSCVRYLSARGCTSFAVVDSRPQPPQLDALRDAYAEVPVYLGGYHEEILATALQLIVSPGVSLREAAIEMALGNGAAIVNDIELFCREATAPVLAVTGSNGKSTVATLVSEMIRHAGKRVLLGGNIGIPALDLLRDTPPDYYVLELSSFQLEPLNSLNARASVVLNVSEDHMDRYRDIDEYSAVKSGIYCGDGRMVINLDDPRVAACRRNGRDTIFYTLGEPGEGAFGVRELEGERYLARGSDRLLPVSRLKLHGDHNVSNCLAALALGSAIDLPMEPMLETLEQFRGLPHRCQWVASINGVHWYNDSKGTNVGASCAAIIGLGGTGPVILIAGGMSKGADFTPLAQTAGKGGLRAAVLIGRDGAIIGSALQDRVPVYYATSMEAAVTTAAGLARAGDVVLLSPACASFDMFRDYQQRGDVFMECVARLARGDRS